MTHHDGDTPRRERVSVIIPTHNRAAFLQRAIESVLTQTMPSLNCIVVNDGGSELGPLPGDARLSVIELSERMGPGGARNAGLKSAGGDFVCFLDDDDFFEPTRLERGLELVSEATIGIVNWISRDRSQRGHTRFSGDFTRRVSRGHWPGIGQALVPRDRCAEFSNLRVSEDFEWWLKMAPHAKFAYTAEPLVVIERHATRRIGVDRETHFECRQRALDMHPEIFDHDRRARAFATGRVATAALAAGLTTDARAWALRSIRTFPSVVALRALGSSLRTSQ